MAGRFPASVCAAAAMAVWCASASSGLDLARQALRDGLWETARSQALALDDDEARLLVLESFAREGAWTRLLGQLDAWPEARGDGYVYYRALALAETGARDDAARALASLSGPSPYASAAAALAVRLALDAGDVGAALAEAGRHDLPAADACLNMAAAAAFAASGRPAEAEGLWRVVAADTNADERVRVAAAVNANDRDRLRALADEARLAAVRRAAGLRLGRLELDSGETFENGARRIRLLAKDAPDTPGADEAFFALADAYLARTNAAAAVEAYRTAFETWPAAAKEFRLQEGRAWALRQLGRHDEAFKAFVRAEEVATNDVDRAKAVLEQGDVLAEAGRGSEAMAHYRRVLDGYPQTPAAEKLKVVVALREMESRGRELFHAYRFDEAREAFARLAEADPARRPRMDYFAMQCLYGLGRDDDARAEARRLADSCPSAAVRAAATLWLAKFEYNRRNWSESRRLFLAYADGAPETADAPAALTWAARAAYADNDFRGAIQIASRLSERYPDSPERTRAAIIQSESLVELARFDEAVLVLDQALLAEDAPAEERLRAHVLKADALFALGADNPTRYEEALAAYRAVRLGESLSPSMKIVVAAKLARTLEKLRRMDEAIDRFYLEVVLAYRDGRKAGVRYDDAAKAAFARAAFRLADEFVSRGLEVQALNVLRLVATSDVPAAAEAERRIEHMKAKGKFL